ncbi:MAG: glycosyltransferase [Candidatus Hadarchaeum sp.]
MMRVLAVSHSCVVDVNQKLFAELTKFPEVELALVAPRVFNTSLRGRISMARLPELHCRLFSLTPFLSGEGLRLNLHFYPFAWRVFREFHPEVVQIDEEPYSLSALQFALGARRCGAKVFFYTKQNILKHYPYPFSAFENKLFHLSDRAVALTEEVAAVLRAKGYSKLIHVIPHAVELTWFRPRDLSGLRQELNLGNMVVGYVGRIWKDKGLEEFLRAIYILREKGIEAKGLIIGSGPDERFVQDMIQELHLNQEIVRIPAVPHNRISDFYNCIDLLCLPSRTTAHWKEQFGRVLIEAMACGVPVVGSDSGAIPYVIRETGGGLIFRERDPEDLAEKLIYLLSNPEERQKLGQRGQESVRQKYSYEMVAKQFYEVYQALI